tara:strand:+ start:347 stop:556 length:210 start_codon:yes stop_codon:yes gene_type:complete
MKFSNQATTTLLMTLQKCLLEETDIVDILKEWEIKEENGELFVLNPPIIKIDNPETTDTTSKFEVPDDL